MIPSVLEKGHLKLGPDVKVTVVDSFESGEAKGGPATVELPPQRIVVTNITEQGFQNEAALRKYFMNPQRSGGGEVEQVVYHGQGRATVTFKDHTG